jgi:hypothetical protein
MKVYKNETDGLHIEYFEDDNGKRTPMKRSLGTLPKRRFADPNAKKLTPWELYQIKEELKAMLKDKL